MEINSTGYGENPTEEKCVRLPYHPPHMVNLGKIESLVQSGTSPGNDGDTNGVGCAS
jgi:hypothetical protein